MPALFNLIRTALLAVIVAMSGPAIAVEDALRQVPFNNANVFGGVS